MKTTKLTATLMATAMALFPLGIVDAAQVSFSAKAPVRGANDIANLTGADSELENVSEGDNDATYIADDRPIQGQTFTTGANPSGYQLRSVTLREASHQTYALIPDLTYTIRITRPSGGALSVLASETAKVPASAPGNFTTIGDGGEMDAGSGGFITFTLDKPVKLHPNTTYGFDVGGGSTRHYWQTDGTKSNAYAAGAAYSVTAKNTHTMRTGDHVFVIALDAVKDQTVGQTSGSAPKGSAKERAGHSGQTGAAAHEVQ